MRNRDDETLEMYSSESEQNLQALDCLLLAAQRAGSLSQQDIAAAFRLVHTLKGASAMMQYPALEQSSHLLEDILSVLRGNNDLPLQNPNYDIVGLCFQYADYFTQQLEQIKLGNDPIVSKPLDTALRNAAASMHIASSAGQDAPYAPPAAAVLASPGSILLNLRLRKCPMPHIRCSVIMKSIHGLCSSILSVPRDIDLHPELSEHILEHGLELYVVPNHGVALAQITDQLKKQPFVVSVSAADASEPSQSAKQQEITIHIPQSKLNRLVAVLDELVTTQSMLADSLNTAGLDSRAAYLMGRLRHEAVQARDMSAEMGMVKIRSVFGQMRRLVRMMAQEYGRQIAFTSTGDTELLDGSMVEPISDALLHLVRNAVDHGIEPPDVRLVHRKKAEGTISLSARKENGLLILTAADDGCGIDRERVLEKAFTKGLLSQKRQTCSDSELLELLASPGFTTKSNVSKYSGRGVGLDTAVKRVHDMKGSISLETTVGQGSRFILRVPTTLSLLNVLPLYIGGERVLLPSSAVAAVCFADKTTNREDKVIYRAQAYSQLQTPAAPSAGKDDVLVFLQPEYGSYYIRAMRTDMVGELLLLPLPQYVSDLLGRANLFCGCCIDKGGDIMCVLDIYKLIAANGTHFEGRKPQ